MQTMTEINGAIKPNWSPDHQNLTKKADSPLETSVSGAAISVLAKEPLENQETSSWTDWGFSIVTNYVSSAAETLDTVVDQLNETANEYFGETEDGTLKFEGSKLEKADELKTGITTHIDTLKTMKGEYDLLQISSNLIKYLTEYKAEVESKFIITNELDALNETIQNLTNLNEKLNVEAKKIEQDNSLGTILSNWMRSFDDTSDNALDSLGNLTADLLSPEQTKFLTNIKEKMISLLPAENNGALYNDQEVIKIKEIKEKVIKNEKLSTEDITNLLCFVEREKNLEKGLSEFLKDKALYDYGYLTKNFLSLTGATIAGLLIGPGAAFAAHNVIGSVYQNYINDAKPNNIAEQTAAFLMNGAVGFATVGVGAAAENVVAQLTEDNAPPVVRDGIAAASIAYLTHLTGASPTITMQVGLVGLLALKGRQLVNILKEDANAVKTAIRNPVSIPGALYGFITKIANETISAIIEKRWDEVGALSAVGLISLGVLIGGSLAGGIATVLVGIYSTNRFFHSEESYLGGATLANSSFREWTAKQLEMFDDAKAQINSLDEVLKSKLSDENDFTKTTEIIRKLTTSLGEN